MNKFIKYLKRILKLINLEEMQILPGHLAFNIVLMIVPVFSLIGVLVSNIGVSKILTALTGNVPNAVISMIESALNVESNNFNLFLFIILSFWMVSGGCRAIISASNVIYKVKDVSVLKTFIKSFLMVIILFLLIAFMIIVPVFGDMIFNFINNYFKIDKISLIVDIYHFIKYPISIILMFFSIKLLYTIAPSITIKSRYMNTGAWFTTISWFTLTRIYSYHLNNNSNYNLYYGSLSNILILFVWIYLLAFLFTIGLTLNADNYSSIKDEND